MKKHWWNYMATICLMDHTHCKCSMSAILKNVGGSYNINDLKEITFCMQLKRTAIVSVKRN